MRTLTRTYRFVVILIAGLLMAGSAVELGATPIDTTTPAYECSTPQHTPITASESHIEVFVADHGLVTTNLLGQSTLPAVRNIARGTRHTVRIDHNVVAARSIDSTQAKSRAGLFNHKILFYTYPRHYYLNGLVRLII